MSHKQINPSQIVPIDDGPIVFVDECSYFF